MIFFLEISFVYCLASHPLVRMHPKKRSTESAETGQNDKPVIQFLSLRTETRGPGRVAQSVTCLATDACLTADPGVASSIPARYYTFVEIDHEIISTVILLPSADLFKKGCCQLQAKVCAQITG